MAWHGCDATSVLLQFQYGLSVACSEQLADKILGLMHCPT